jgi:hypothetical protein
MYKSYTLVSAGSSLVKFQFLHFFQTFTTKDFWFYNIHIHFVVLFIFVLIYVYQLESHNSGKTLKELIKTRKTLLLEVILLVAFLSILPILMLKIPGGSAIYFSGITQRMSALLLITLSPFIAQVLFQRFTYTKKLLLLILLIPYILVIVDNSKRTFKRTRKNHRACKSKIIKKTGAQKVPKDSLKEYLSTRSEFKFMKKLDSLNKLPVEEKNKLLIHIPHSDSTFYNYFAPPRVWKTPFVIPALTGIALINGLPTHPEVRKTIEYGFVDYQNRHVPFIGSDSLPKIKERAKSLGLGDKKIIQLHRTYKNQQ